MNLYSTSSREFFYKGASGQLLLDKRINICMKCRPVSDPFYHITEGTKKSVLPENGLLQKKSAEKIVLVKFKMDGL